LLGRLALPVVNVEVVDEEEKHPSRKQTLPRQEESNQTKALHCEFCIKGCMGQKHV
jgi:hypothetical protein